MTDSSDFDAGLTGMDGARMFGATGAGAVGPSWAEKAAAVAAAQTRRQARHIPPDALADGIRIAEQLGHCPGAILRYLRQVEAVALNASGDIAHRARASGL